MKAFLERVLAILRAGMDGGPTPGSFVRAVRAVDLRMRHRI